MAITVKYAKDLENPRVVEKLEIERHYWQRRGIDWLIITENQINSILVKNIKWIHPYLSLTDFLPDITPEQMEITADYLFQIIRQNKTPLRNAVNTTDIHFTFPSGTTLSLVRHLIVTRQLIVNMIIPIQPAKPLCAISLNIQEVSK